MTLGTGKLSKVANPEPCLLNSVRSGWNGREIASGLANDAHADEVAGLQVGRRLPDTDAAVHFRGFAAGSRAGVTAGRVGGCFD